jgi:hypothetical protein
MAITKVVKVREVRVYPATDSSAADSSNDKWPTLRVTKEFTLDDTGDAELPIVSQTRTALYRYNSDGSAYDFASEDNLVKTIIGGVWT